MTDRPTAVETIRAAASKLRALATAASPGLRTAVPRLRKGTDTVIQYDLYGPPAPGSNMRPHKAVHPSRAAEELYNVATHPGVGLALAAWLDAEADRLDRTALPEWQADIAPHPLATARAILGQEGKQQ